YVGYKGKSIPSSFLRQGDEIFLQSADYNLKEVVIHATDDYLYDIIQKCKANMNNAESFSAKVFFELETETENEPIEILECYYNGKFSKASIQELLFKNGRGANALSSAHGYFHSYNTSKAFTELSLTQLNDHFPFIPFQ